MEYGIYQNFSAERTGKTVIKKANSRMCFMNRKENFLSAETRTNLNMSPIQRHVPRGSPTYSSIHMKQMSFSG